MLSIVMYAALALVAAVAFFVLQPPAGWVDAQAEAKAAKAQKRLRERERSGKQRSVEAIVQKPGGDQGEEQ